MLKTLAGQSSSREVVQDSRSPDLLFHVSTVAPQVRRSNVVAQDVTLFCRLFTTAEDQIVRLLLIRLPQLRARHSGHCEDSPQHSRDATLSCRLFTTSADQIVFYLRSVRDSFSNSHADTYQSIRFDIPIGCQHVTAAAREEQ